MRKTPKKFKRHEFASIILFCSVVSLVLQPDTFEKLNAFFIGIPISPTFQYSRLNYSEIVKYSIVIPTYNRFKCFQRAFERVMSFRPACSEVIVIDDCSTEIKKILYLNTIEKLYNGSKFLKIVRHNKTIGAFHSKIEGFKMSKGKFVMSCDDDDTFNESYYQEIADHIDENYDFIIPRHNFMIKYFNINTFTRIEDLILTFHNHVAYAFRKSLIDNVEYPPLNISIIRDDAPITIPLYLQTNFSRLLFFDNSGRYILDRYCKGRHESGKYKRKRELVANGYIFLFDLMKKSNVPNSYIKALNLSYEKYVFLNQTLTYTYNN